MIRGLMLVALVASKLEPKLDDKPKFIDYTPEPRKKRKYKRMTDDIHEIQKKVLDQEKEIAALTKENKEMMQAITKQDVVHGNDVAELSKLHREFTDLAIKFEDKNFELSRQSQRIQQLEEALRELWNGTITLKLKENIESLLSKFEVPNQS